MSLEIIIDGIIGNGPGEISAQMVKSQLPATGEPITVKIHSEGGSVFEGFAIYDALARYQGQKTAVIESSAFSIASFIPMACDQVEITPNGYMMLHNPWVEVEGDDDELAKLSALLRQLKGNMVAAYSQRTGKPEDEILAILKDETYFNADDAVAMGLANRITAKPITGRVFARLEKMPHGVVSALFGQSDSDGNQEPPHKDKPMSDSTPVAATLQEIKAAYPKAKAEFVIKCLERSMPMASVAQAAVEEMMAENAALASKCQAMEEELMALKGAKAETTVEVEEEMPEEEMAATAQARGGVKPVAKAKTSGQPAAGLRWKEAVTAALPQARGDRTRAAQIANRANPGLREAMLAEANAK